MKTLIEKYSRRHKELYSVIDSDYVASGFQLDMLMAELKLLTEFLKDLRLLQREKEELGSKVTSIGSFKFESPAFEQAKEKVRKEYNRVTIKSTGKVDVSKDETNNEWKVN